MFMTQYLIFNIFFSLEQARKRAIELLTVKMQLYTLEKKKLEFILFNFPISTMQLFLAKLYCINSMFRLFWVHYGNTS
jgi:hypothetical protein